MSRIIQITVSFTYGDAIGNHILAIYRALCEKGIETKIYAEHIGPRVGEYADYISEYDNQDTDIILYHLSSGTPLNRRFASFKGRKIINYHNITPPSFILPYNKKLAGELTSGYEDVAFLADKIDLAIGVSNYNGEDLRRMGYTCDIATVPIIMDFKDFEKEPDPAIMEEYDSKNGITNIVFVGRIAPNKKQEDIITDFYYYTKYFNPNSRLTLVGNYGGFEGYYLRLKKYVKKLGLKNVTFTGHIKFSEILAYYKTADVFLCESEHEGFCVPLLEAMYFNVPIIAYDSSAIAETLGGAGILLKEKKPQLTAAIIDTLMKNKDMVEKICTEQKTRLAYFQSSEHVDKLIRLLTRQM